MPHIVIKCYKGREREQLKSIAEKVAASAAEAFEMPQGNVSVSIEEVEKESWKDVYNNEIYGDPEKLFIEPKYKV